MQPRQIYEAIRSHVVGKIKWAKAEFWSSDRKRHSKAAYVWFRLLSYPLFMGIALTIGGIAARNMLMFEIGCTVSAYTARGYYMYDQACKDWRWRNPKD